MHPKRDDTVFMHSLQRAVSSSTSAPVRKSCVPEDMAGLLRRCPLAAFSGSVLACSGAYSGIGPLILECARANAEPTV